HQYFLPLWSGADNSPTKSDCNPFFHESVTSEILAVFLDFTGSNRRNPTIVAQICVRFSTWVSSGITSTRKTA
ncbi:hypothetical protein, partial [Thalassospira lohafexi]|uniref:hypothetical protein n=1 Tax=Thalassospira lohafexi TaxID=744227 RepID=UPI0019821FAD